MFRVAVTLDPAAFSLPSRADAPGPTFEFDLAAGCAELAACELVFAICNSYPDELHCPGQFAPIVAAYRDRRLRSLSCGDTIVLSRDGATRSYRVAPVGFVRADVGQ